MAKAIYFYDLKTFEFSHSEVLFDGDEMPTDDTSTAGSALGVTAVKPADGLATPRKFDVDGQAWIGATAEEHEKRYPTPAPVLTDEQAANAQLVLQMAENKVSQDQINAQLLLQMASTKVAEGA